MESLLLRLFDFAFVTWRVLGRLALRFDDLDGRHDALSHLGGLVLLRGWRFLRSRLFFLSRFF